MAPSSDLLVTYTIIFVISYHVFFLSIIVYIYISSVILRIDFLPFRAIIFTPLFCHKSNHYQLKERIQALLPEYSLEITNNGSNGATIKQILERLPDVLATQPEAVILFWDSDVSDIDESKMNPDELKVIITRY